MRWQVYLSYRIGVPISRNDPDSARRGVEYGRVHDFDTYEQAVLFQRRSRAATGWLPPGAFDADVSDIIEIHEQRRTNPA